MEIPSRLHFWYKIFQLEMAVETFMRFRVICGIFYSVLWLFYKVETIKMFSNFKNDQENIMTEF